jgi:hypothetical protein
MEAEMAAEADTEMAAEAEAEAEAEAAETTSPAFSWLREP